MAQKKILIREAGISDSKDILRLYERYMFDSYLLKFGSSFVLRYLRIILNSKDCRSFIAEEDNVAVGFIAAAFDSKMILSKIFKDIKIIAIYLKQIFLRPGLFLTSLGIIFYSRRTYLEGVSAELLFISIEPRCREIGLAKKLIEEELKVMKSKGIKKVKVSAAKENKIVNILLNKLGFKLERFFSFLGKKTCLYSHKIENNI